VRIIRAFAAYLLGTLAWEVGLAPGLTGGDDGTARRPQPAEFPRLAELHSDLRASDIDGDLEFGVELFARAIAARAT
jgi:TetR/AcrR family transcriptional regulator, tetracycline repressor protein